MNHFLFSFISLMFIGCAQTKNISNFPEEIILQLNEKITLGNQTILFQKVVEDSRCPTDLDCFWAGRAVLQFEIISEESTSEIKTIYVGETRQGEPKSQLIYQDQTQTYLVTTVLPIPKKGIEIKEYQVVLKKEKQ